MPGTVIQTLTNLGNNSGMKTLAFSWIADAAAHTVPDTATSAEITAAIEGMSVIWAVTNPGVVAPTDDYDIVINDADGMDIFGGALANRDTANTEQAFPLTAGVYMPRPVYTALTFSLSNNSVNSATGICTLVLIR